MTVYYKPPHTLHIRVQTKILKETIYRFLTKRIYKARNYKHSPQFIYPSLKSATMARIYKQLPQQAKYLLYKISLPYAVGQKNALMDMINCYRTIEQLSQLNQEYGIARYTRNVYTTQKLFNP